jgi:hypothetical protein
MKVIWSKADYLSAIGTNHSMVRWLLTALAPGQPWKQNHIEISCDWLYQNTGLALTQFFVVHRLYFLQLLGFDLGFSLTFLPSTFRDKQSFNRTIL